MLKLIKTILKNHIQYKLEKSIEAFDKYRQNYFKPGYSETYNLAGRDNYFLKYSGTLTIKTKNYILQEGKELIPIEERLIICSNHMNEAVETITTNFYQFIDSNYYQIYSLNNGLKDILTEPQLLETNLKFGETINIHRLPDTNNNQVNTKIELRSTLNKGFRLIYNVSAKNIDQMIFYKSNSDKRFNSTGTYQSVKLEYNYIEKNCKYFLKGKRANNGKVYV